MKKAWNICAGVLALSLMLASCAAPAAQQTSQTQAAAEIEEPVQEPSYVPHAAYMSAPRGFFEPDRSLRRAEAAQLICNLAGISPVPQETSGYVDVQPNDWYYGAVCAAAEFLEPQQKQAAESVTEEEQPEKPEQTEQPEKPEEAERFFRPMDVMFAYELQQALCSALGLFDAQYPENMNPMRVLTRADAAKLINALLGRTPDREALEEISYDLLLDMPRTDARYYDVLEAVFPHAYFLEEQTERWNMQDLELSRLRAGAHTKQKTGFVVDGEGCVIRKKGIFSYDGWRYLSDSETGHIFADAELHRTDGKVVYALLGGQILQSAAHGEYFFDENGFYTTGREDVDALLDAAIADCTTQDMTQDEMLRACYDYVRGYQYLGRNAAFGAEVKSPPYEKLLEFAEKILSTGKGDCYNFAASFCLLARRLGYDASCIVGECGYVWNWKPIAHGWVEITRNGQTLLYDPQIENYNNRAGISNDDYGAFGVSYETAHAQYLKH